jgi:HD-GYP domain-containing protein (c-di-GMP phosphodiesterase class II)
MKLLLSLSTVALLAVTMTAVFALTEHNARRALQQQLETRLLLEARHLALLSTDALLTDFPELTLCPIVTEMMHDRSDLALAVVVDHAGLVQGHADVHQLGKPLASLGRFGQHPTSVGLTSGEELLLSDDLLAAQVPARHAGGQVLGTVMVAMNRGHLDAMLARTRQQVALVAAVLLALGVALALTSMQRLLAPVQAIRDGIRRIGEGNLDTVIKVQSRTELGLLADTINTMADQLKRSREIADAREREIIQTQSEVIHTLGEVVESRSHETGGHIDRVADSAALLARLAGLPAQECRLVRMASPMHDVGKIAVSDAILHKPGKLTDEEFAEMQQHAAVGARILSQSDRPVFKAAAIIAGQHHERWDGRGYPARLAGDAIHLYGRIVAIVDVFDALTSDRCYRPAMSLEKALDIMQQGRGTQFDPQLLDLFLEHFGDFACLTEVINRERHEPLVVGRPAGRVVDAAEPETVPI